MAERGSAEPAEPSTESRTAGGTPGDPGPGPAGADAVADPPPPSSAGELRLSRRRVLVGGAALLAVGAGVGAELLNLLDVGHLIGPGPSGPAHQGSVSSPASASEIAAPSSSAGPVAPDASMEDEPIESGPPTGPARAARENQLTGSRRWELPLTGKGDAEGYPGDASVAAGDPLVLHVKASAPAVHVTVYRLGYYGGLGARAVARWKDVPIAPQPAPTTNPTTGLIRAAWTPAVTVKVPDSWVSGLYLAVLQPVGGRPQYASFVVREAAPSAPILIVSAATTHQAYNTWGGKSLYPDVSTGAPTMRGDAGAVAVSFDRPYESYRGAGLVLRWEYAFARWVESNGYDVAYAADMDLERNPSIVAERKLLLFVGHPEYWSVAMRRTLEAAIADGVNVAWFSGNEMLWRTRYEDLAGGLYRSVTCYRLASLDPLASMQPDQATTKWREPPSPEPESLVIGQMAGHIVLEPGDFVCSAPNHWLFAGTGMALGDSITRLVGQEYDGFWPQYAPAGTQIVSSSPVRSNVTRNSDVYGPVQSVDPTVNLANATVYTAPSGATVFAAGTIQWSWGLDDWGTPDYEGFRTPTDPRVGIMTANVLAKLGQ
jgi:hypothetical protein